MNHREKEDLEALREGSEKAFARIYDRYAGKLYHFVMGLSGGDGYMAEEMVQTTFIRLWETRERIDPRKTILSYLATIAKNSLYNSYRRQTLEYLYRESQLRSEPLQESITEEQIEVRWLSRELDALIDRLPPARKRIFLMSRKEQLSPREIAQQLGVALSTVETQLTLAVRTLRLELERHRNKLLLLAAWMVNNL